MTETQDQGENAIEPDRRTATAVKWWVGLVVVLTLVEGATSRGRPGVTGWSYWAIIFAIMALRKDGLLTRQSGHRIVAWVMGAFTAVGVLSVWLASFGKVEQVRSPGEVSLPKLIVFALLLLAVGVLVIVNAVRAARQREEPPVFTTWPPCNTSRRRGAAIAALAFSAICLTASILAHFELTPGGEKQQHTLLGMGLFYGGATLVVGIQMWRGRMVAGAVGVLVPIMLVIALLLSTLGLAGRVAPLPAIAGTIGAVVCTVFLIRGVTCRPAM